MQRGNLNMEYMVMMAIFLVVMPFFLIFIQHSHLSLRLNQARDMVGMLAITANAVHNLGPGNKDSIWVRVPPDVQNTTVQGKRIAMNLSVGDDSYDVDQNAEPDLIGQIPSRGGYRQIPVKAINSTLVKIGPGPALYQVNPPCVTKNSLPREIILIGDEFDQNATVYIDGIEYFDVHQSGYVTFVSSSEIRFLADAPHFESDPNGDYSLSVQTSDGDTSNTISFRVIGNFGACSR